MSENKHCILHLLLREVGSFPSYKKISDRKVPTRFDTVVEAQTYNLLSSKQAQRGGGPVRFVWPGMKQADLL
jgi:hypothetical protein